MSIVRTFIYILFLASPTFAQQVYVQMPPSTGYVNVPMNLVVVYENIESPLSPSIPEIDGFTIDRIPNEQRSTQTTIINGKMTRTAKRIFTFVLTPKETGVFTIPVLTFKVGDRGFQSSPQTITIQDPPTGGALELEISGTNGDVYIGQPIDLTLKIFIEQFTDPNLGVTLNAQAMVSLLDRNLGIFTKSFEEQQYQLRQIQGKTDAGIPTTFYEVSIHTTVWPETSGPFILEPVSILMNYPLALQKARGIGFFRGDSYNVTQSHLIAAHGEMPTINVLTPPSKDQPMWYSGAVGNYDFRVIADPTHVKVGEPITLTMRITDRTNGPINLDFLSAPHLDRVPALTDHFRVPDTPLGGIAEGRTKTFTQSIRPRSEGVTEIPPLPMSWYDPISDTYQTVWTKPITISVEAVATVSASDLVGDIARTTQATPLTEVDGGILANYTGEDLLKSQRITLSPLLIGAIALPPTLLASIFFILAYRKRSQKSLRSTKGRIKHATYSIRLAKSLVGEEQVQSLSTALRELQNVKAGSDVSKDIDTLLSRCDAMQFGGCNDDTLAKDAETLVESIL
ncbi:MAG: BatD family protein [Planctomycetes bacterium]|nr:BatD family protein [Planctomycetota bacterium]